MNTTLHGFTEHGFTELEYRRIYFFPFLLLELYIPNRNQMAFSVINFLYF